MSDKQPPVERESFEEALDRLEQITRALEGGDIELDQSLALYEEGIRLVRLAEDVIREAEIRIERLHEDGSTSRINVGERQG
jgi:exodeoxyribonuclease VII small subunit